MSSGGNDRHTSSPVRFSLATDLGDNIDGAWWPHSGSIARELPDLIDAVRDRLGEVIDISVNWSSLDGVPDLDSLGRGGVLVVPGRPARRLRIMTVNGSRARAHLLVVPCRTSTALAIMLLRQAAALPILHSHQLTTAFQSADAIVHAARTQDVARAVGDSR